MLNYYKTDVRFLCDGNEIDGFVKHEILDEKEAVDSLTQYPSLEDVYKDGWGRKEKSLLRKGFIVEIKNTVFKSWRCPYKLESKKTYTQEDPTVEDLLKQSAKMVNQYLIDHNLEGLHL